MSVTVQPYGSALGLSSDEYDQILEILGREPSATELAMFSVEWSEHCGYPRSRLLLSRLPREGKYKPMVGTDAGGIEVDGKLVLFKVESHNHPSQVEPRAGAMTGVGGIIRDIVSMGARPIALLDSLKFGDARDPSTAFYVKGVVDGIQFYGNCVGVPTVGGEVFFDAAYGGNCLVNVMCVGVARPESLMTSRAVPGVPIMYLGSRTGRDGIGGCSVLASQEFGASDAKRPTVQIGDPFSGKCLIEATLEAIESGTLVALKDMGAAGLTCTTAEMASAGQCGMDVELQNVPRREDGMEAYEIMMSESQERMLAAVKPGREADVQAIFHRWGLCAEVIGKTVETPVLTIRDAGRVVAQIPVMELTNPRPIPLPQSALPPVPAVGSIQPSGEWKRELLQLLASPNLSSRRWIFRQYDSMVQIGTVIRPGDADAAVVRLPDSDAGLALAMDSCARYAALDPYEGARLAVAEACRNVSCVGAEPAGLTDCLNFANPNRPDRFWQFARSIEGLADACREFGIPVVSGNVSFYNESPRGPILPTATVGVVGVLEDVRRCVRTRFVQAGHGIALVGEGAPMSLDGSEYAIEVHGQPLGGRPPGLDIKHEKALQSWIRANILNGRIASAHDLSEGGLLISLAECCLSGNLGAEVRVDASDRALAYFGEAPSRILISATPDNLEALRQDGSMRMQILGKVTSSDVLSIDEFDLPLAELRRAAESLPEVLKL